MASECERGDSPSHRGGRGVDGVCAPAPPRLSPQPQGSQLPLALMGRSQLGPGVPAASAWLEDTDSDSSSHRQLCFCFQSSECRHLSPWAPEPVSRVDEPPSAGQPGPTVLVGVCCTIPGPVGETFRNASKVNAQTGPPDLHGLPHPPWSARRDLRDTPSQTVQLYFSFQESLLSPNNRVPLKLKHFSRQGKATAPRLTVGCNGRE